MGPGPLPMRRTHVEQDLRRPVILLPDEDKGSLGGTVRAPSRDLLPHGVRRSSDSGRSTSSKLAASGATKGPAHLGDTSGIDPHETFAETTFRADQLLLLAETWAGETDACGRKWKGRISSRSSTINGSAALGRERSSGTRPSAPICVESRCETWKEI